MAYKGRYSDQNPNIFSPIQTINIDIFIIFSKELTEFLKDNY